VRSSNLINENGEPAKWNVFTKTFLKDVIQGATAKPNNFIEGYINQMASHELNALGIPFDYAKPTELIKFLIEICKVKDNDIILDFFSGSASTAHAVFKANCDGEKRKFIMVQLPEEIDEKKEEYKFLKSIGNPTTIAELGKERIRRVGKKMTEENHMIAPNLDIGFRVMKLDDSNMREVFYNPKQYDQAMLTSLDVTIKEDRTSEDILFQVMLDKGVSLSSKIEKRTTTNGKQAYYIVGNTDFGIIDLICVLDKKVNTDAVKEIAKLGSECVVFLDSGIESDATRTNIQQVFDTYSPKTKVEVL
jgi:adenine-specific DNA-methyltransferase